MNTNLWRVDSSVVRRQQQQQEPNPVVLQQQDPLSNDGGFLRVSTTTNDPWNFPHNNNNHRSFPGSHTSRTNNSSNSELDRSSLGMLPQQRQQQPERQEEERSQQRRRKSLELEAASAISSNGNSSQKPFFSLQTLKWNAANAPVMERAAAPLVSRSNERKRALTSAKYYSECFLNGIQPVQADTAALAAAQQYDKWWVLTKHPKVGTKRGEESNTTTTTSTVPLKRRKLQPSSSIEQQQVGQGEGELSTTSARHVSVVSEDEAIMRGGGGDNTTESSLWRRKKSQSSSSGNQFLASLQQNQQNNNNHSQSLLSSTFSSTVSLRRQQQQDAAAAAAADKLYGTSNYYYAQDAQAQAPPCFDTQNDAFYYHHHQHPNKRGGIPPTVPALARPTAEQLKAALVQDLRLTEGETSSPTFLQTMDALHRMYLDSQADARWNTTEAETSIPNMLDGSWLTLSKPTFSECLGSKTTLSAATADAGGATTTTESKEPLYALGRLAFDMFRPTNLICSIQGVYNVMAAADTGSVLRPLSFPVQLLKEQAKSQKAGKPYPAIRKYDIVVAFTVEPNQTRRGTRSEAGLDTNDKKAQDDSGGEYTVKRPIRGLLRNQGYCVPDPSVPNRLSVWFSGGSLQPQDSTDLELWRELFDANQVPRRDLTEYARVLATRVLLGAHFSDSMDAAGTMSYTLQRPIGGHGSVFVDVLYQDENFRVVKGHRGSIFCFERSKQNEY